MNPNPSVTRVDVRDDITVRDARSPVWGAIFAGLIAGLGVHLLMLMLLTAIGLGAADPATDDNPVATLGIGAAVAWCISSLVSLFAGGWVAGRCAARVHSVSGGVHGFLVWCIATLAGVLMVASGAGALVGGATRIAGQGLSAAAKPLGGVADLAKQAVEENAGTINSMVEEATQSPAVQNAKNGAVAARREIGHALRQLFREGGNLRDPQARTAAVRALTEAGMSEADANQMLDRWSTSIERMRTELEQAKTAAAAKAREAADKTAKAVAHAALWSFIALVVGAIAASFGGRSGAHWEYRHTEIGADVTLDPAHRPIRTPAHAAGHA